MAYFGTPIGRIPTYRGVWDSINNMVGFNNDPQQVVNNLMNSNPQFKNIVDQVQKSGLTPQQYLNNYCSQNNINIQPIIQMLTQRGIKL